MGIVRKQSFISSIFIYLGFAIGALNTAYFFPKFFTTEQLGLTKLLVEIAAILATFCTLGSATATVKFFPFYKSYLPAKKNDLPFITLLSCIIGCVLFLCLLPFLKDFIIRKFSRNSSLFVEHFLLLVPLTLSYTFWMLFESIEWCLQHTVLTNFLKEVGFRLMTLLFISVFLLGWVTFNQFMILYSCLYIIPVLILLVHLYKQHYFNFSFKLSKVTQRLWKFILTFSLFIFSGQMLALLARTSDTILISSKSSNGLADTAVFTIATFAISVMEVPQRGMMGIAVSIITFAWKDKDMAKIEEMYKKTALTLTILGLAIGCCIYLNAANLVAFFGKSYALLPSLLLILSIAKLIDLGTGLNSQILLSSKHWKIDFGTNMFLVVLSIFLNYFLIEKYGVIGSAYANLIAMITYNLIRLLFIWKLFGMLPYDAKSLLPLLIGGVAFAIAYWIPHFNNYFIDGILRTTAFLLIYVTAILSLNVSKDINDLYKLMLGRIGLTKNIK
jgi:O-antigen/teichoic acid export membrane protein